MHPLFGEFLGLDLQQGGPRYRWDGQSTYGMIERSAPRWPRPAPRAD